MFSSLLFSQNISTSKDTLIFNYNNQYWQNYYYDSLIVNNSSNNILSIDSITNHNGLYSISYFANGRVVENYIWESDLYPIVINPNDSLKIIFEFILPVTRGFDLATFREDSLILCNNSTNFPSYKISVLNDVPLKVNNKENQPVKFKLFQNYPNPFNPSTIIKYTINSEGFVNLSIYNVKGEMIKTLVNRFQSIGEYSLTYKAQELASGIYFYRLQSDKKMITKKFILIK